MTITGPETREAAEVSAYDARRRLGEGWTVTIHETPDWCSAFTIICEPKEPAHG